MLQFLLPLVNNMSRGTKQKIRVAIKKAFYESLRFMNVGLGKNIHQLDLGAAGLLREIRKVK